MAEEKVPLAPGAPRMHPPPASLAPAVLGFVHRDDPAGGGVMRLLPELRASIQIMLGDPYWLRGSAPTDTWTQLPRISLWGPKHCYSHGYAARHIRAYALGLTAAGLAALTHRPATELVDRVCPLTELDPDLAASLEPLPAEAFTAWRVRVVPTLEERFSTLTPSADALLSSLAVLATTEGGAVARAATAAGLSERQYRRRFLELHGVTPKVYQRTLRVDRMLRQLHTRPWEADAFPDEPIPFADQPHAIREFRALTGFTPGEYLRRKGPGDATLRSVPFPELDPPQRDPPQRDLTQRDLTQLDLTQLDPTQHDAAPAP